ncbi:hypothetical protein GCM10008018_67180 [Paenibacillus marchantiophytorum]|uniref:Uncharacterized protein n=1 Tax=Paenibacillus marchantiophytorum TaxID=1619310 RepID=A0ABQ1FIY4_9BACL|nr:hypothetical protein [Paenibacillus marchantiophytorum]GGA12717.1 hypothetical protein GCM10008018_67180 [Paenibacillus marchantiophytorum]
MTEELGKEILKEIREINEKLDQINEPRGLSTPMKFIALLFGCMVVGPIILLIMSRVFG